MRPDYSDTVCLLVLTLPF